MWSMGKIPPCGIRALLEISMHGFDHFQLLASHEVFRHFVHQEIGSPNFIQIFL